MDDKYFERIIGEASEIPVPEGLAERLERQIDDLAIREKKQKARRFIYWVSSAAAAILLCGGILFSTRLGPRQQIMADTFTDPAEAAVAAEKALDFMSSRLNKGFDQVSDAGHEIKKANQILNKHLIKNQ